MFGRLLLRTKKFLGGIIISIGLASLHSLGYNLADRTYRNPLMIQQDKRGHDGKIIATSNSLNIHLETSGVIQWGSYDGANISVVWDAKFLKSSGNSGHMWALSSELVD